MADERPAIGGGLAEPRRRFNGFSFDQREAVALHEQEIDPRVSVRAVWA